MSKLSTCLWFDTQAEEAANFYIEVFRQAGQEAAIGQVSRRGDAGAVLTITFNLAGQEFMGLNGGPHFKGSPAVSVVVNCADQAEVDHFWDRLCEGGAPSQCGWLTDRYGFSWQIVPVALRQLMTGNPDGAKRAMAALMKMAKLDIAALRRAYEGQDAI